MKYSSVILTTITLVAALVVSGCDRQSNNVERAEVSVIEANRDLEIAKSEVEAELRIYRAENNDRSAKHNRSIEDIKLRISNESDREVRLRHERRLEEYQTTHNQLKRDMDNYRVSGRENWNDFKNRFDDRMKDLGNSLDNFFSDSRTTTPTRNN